MALPKALQTSDLIFSANSTNFSTTLASLKKSTLSIPNRLTSILDDAQFVSSVADAFALPLIANERCGAWYIPPAHKAASAYFKSTDGHAGQWAFSLRRLNTQVLDVIGRHDGCVLVDSTRRGKRMPDALAKTVPIWCAVLNRALFPERADARRVFTAGQSVAASEHDQIERRVDGWVERLREIKVDLPSLRSKIQKPLRPIWVTRETNLADSLPSFKQFHLVVLCTASRRVPGGEVSEGGYIQGAGDDSEGWAYGLTPPLFWAHVDELLASPADDLPDLIEELVSRSGETSKVLPTSIEPTSWISVGSSDMLESEDASGLDLDAIIHCGERKNDDVAERLKSKYLHLQCQTGKLGSRDLRKELTKLDSFITSLPPGQLFICCPTGKDLSLGVALAIICRFCNNEGEISLETSTSKIDKDLIRQRMAWITTSLPTANPSRATLQSVNSYLMSSSSTSDGMSTTPPPDAASPVTPPKMSSTLSLFKSLPGSWTFSRMLDSRLVTHPSGTVDGTATFTERDEARVTRQDRNELMYEEIGVFKTTTGLEFSARRKYIYRYDTTDDEISVRFVGSDGEADEGLFVEIEKIDEGSEGIRSAKSKSKHLCAADLYDATYQFNFKKSEASPELERWQVRYDVKGPQKDYVSNTIYERKT